MPGGGTKLPPRTKVPGPKMAVTMAPRLLTPRQVADELGVGMNAVYAAMDRNALRFRTVAGRRLITPEAMEEYRARPTREYRDPRRGRKQADETKGG